MIWVLKSRKYPRGMVTFGYHFLMTLVICGHGIQWFKSITTKMFIENFFNTQEIILKVNISLPFFIFNFWVISALMIISLFSLIEYQVNCERAWNSKPFCSSSKLLVHYYYMLRNFKPHLKNYFEKVLCLCANIFWLSKFSKKNLSVTCPFFLSIPE